uniref:Radial spoke head 3 n=1 Tax=Varanus komodoensis TaxID=61221 RepID=A0A8D2JGZ3_VARKO
METGWQVPQRLSQRRRRRPPLTHPREEPIHYANLMYERRVVRGNTYALHVLPWLFDFDIEVQPMLEVLVGKTIEQALLEVMEEEELADLRAHQCIYQELRFAELAEVQRLEEQERRHREEKQRRKKQQMLVLQKEKETSEKIAARAFAQRYLSDLIPSVFSSLRDSGYFFDPVERDVETGFFPWVMEKVEETMESKTLGRLLTDSELNILLYAPLGCSCSASSPAPAETPCQACRRVLLQDHSKLCDTLPGASHLHFPNDCPLVDRTGECVPAHVLAQIHVCANSHFQKCTGVLAWGVFPLLGQDKTLHNNSLCRHDSRSDGDEIELF